MFLLRSLSILFLWAALTSCCPLYLSYAIYQQKGYLLQTDSVWDNSKQFAVGLHADHRHYPPINMLTLTFTLTNPTTDTLFVPPNHVHLLSSPLIFTETAFDTAYQVRTNTPFIVPPGGEFRLAKTYTCKMRCSFKKFRTLLATQPTILTLNGLKLGAKPLTFDTLLLVPAPVNHR